MGRPVFLTGMMGAGKSSVGSEVAKELGIPMVDLDQRIERMFGHTVDAAFARGEGYFRDLERAALRGLVGEPGFCQRDVVVATGGGVVIDPGNVDAMNRAGITVLLDIAPAEAAKRLTKTTARPLLSRDGPVETRLQELWDERRAAYQKCSYSVDAAAPPRIVAHRVVQVLRETRSR